MSHLRKKQSEITPEIHSLPHPHIGVFFDMKDAVRMTVDRILQSQNILPKEIAGNEVEVETKYGFDGSGSHSMLNQSNNVGTNNIIMTMICPLKLSDRNGTQLYIQNYPNAPLTHRPLCLQMGKESESTLRSLEPYEDDIA